MIVIGGSQNCNAPTRFEKQAVSVVDNPHEGAAVSVFKLPAVDLERGSFGVTHFIPRDFQRHAEGSGFGLFQHER